MKIAVDVCLGRRGAALLRAAGHEVLEAEHGEPDRVWLTRARKTGARLFVSADADVEIFAWDADIAFIRAGQGENGESLARRVLARLEATAL